MNYQKSNPINMQISDKYEIDLQKHNFFSWKLWEELYVQQGNPKCIIMRKNYNVQQLVIFKKIYQKSKSKLHTHIWCMNKLSIQQGYAFGSRPTARHFHHYINRMFSLGKAEYFSFVFVFRLVRYGIYLHLQARSNSHGVIS